MPYVDVILKPGEGQSVLQDVLNRELPDIVAPALSLDDQPLHEGRVTPSEIMVTSKIAETTNGKDIEIRILAHNYRRRVKTSERRKNQIIEGVKKSLAGSRKGLTVAVCLVLSHMAYGEFEL